jgi:DnaK suppressor protein
MKSMPVARKERYKKILHHKIDEILKANSKPIFSKENLNGLLPDLYDLASFETERVCEYALKDRERRSIVELVDAIKRIEDGRYGVCESCGAAISEKRLKVAPGATQQAEQGRKVHTALRFRLDESSK